MTHYEGTHAREQSVLLQPEPETLVLLNRPLRPAQDVRQLSQFADDRWHLSPGIFEEHHAAISISFHRCPAVHKAGLKRYLWTLINTEDPVPLRRGGGTGLLSLITVARIIGIVTAFMTFLEMRSVHSLTNVTTGHYDQYLAWVRELESSHAVKEDLVTEVRRLWSYRAQLPPIYRLPDPAPWDDDLTRDLVGGRTGEDYNRTPRITEEVMTPLLAWSIRFVDDFADDIIAAFAEYKALRTRNGRGKSRQLDTLPPPGMVLAAEWLEDLRIKGGSLPGKRGGTQESLRIDWEHVHRLLDSPAIRHQHSEARRLIASSALPIEEGAQLSSPLLGKIDGLPWLDGRIQYLEAAQHARRLSTACFIIISYLSGQRVGEALSLRRGCVAQDATTRLWLLRGKTWKSSKDDSGNKVPQGTERTEPWVVIELVARAVVVLEQLHDSELLFPNVIDPKDARTTVRGGTARIPASINQDLNAFVVWIEGYCHARGRSDAIPRDPSGRLITGSRFRRTLAWHIYRRPRGLIAGAVQYGHLRTQMFLGYAGNYASGFPDDVSFEEFLRRLEEISEHAQQLEAGEHVSGPAADRYRDRVLSSNRRFAGRVLTTSQAINAVRSNPDLQVFSGQAMTCVFDARTALCEVERQSDSRTTPSLDDCRPGCANIARTDRDVEALLSEADDLRKLVQDPLAPSIRHRREQTQLQAIEAEIERHRTSRSSSGQENG